MKDRIISILVLLLILVVSFLVFRKVLCLKINKDHGYTVGEIIKIKGRENNDVEYAEYKYLVNNHTYTASTRITFSNVFEPEKYLVIYCKGKPSISVLIMNHTANYPLGSDLDTKIEKDSINVRWQIL